MPTVGDIILLGINGRVSYHTVERVSGDLIEFDASRQADVFVDPQDIEAFGADAIGVKIQTPIDGVVLIFSAN